MESHRGKLKVLVFKFRNSSYVFFLVVLAKKRKFHVMFIHRLLRPDASRSKIAPNHEQQKTLLFFLFLYGNWCFILVLFDNIYLIRWVSLLYCTCYRPLIYDSMVWLFAVIAYMNHLLKRGKKWFNTHFKNVSTWN